MIGYGTTSDAGHITAPDPHGLGAAAAMNAAIDDAGLQPDQIDYINAHGTSTPLGDKAETEAIAAVLGDHAKEVAISSTKGALGHSLGASGGIEAIICCRTLQTGTVPPTINLRNPDPACNLNYTPLQAIQRPVNVAMSNSFGFGGHNACVVMRRWPA